MNDISVLLRIRLLFLILADVVVDLKVRIAREPGEHKLVRHKVARHHGKDRWDNDSSAWLCLTGRLCWSALWLVAFPALDTTDNSIRLFPQDQQIKSNFNQAVP